MFQKPKLIDYLYAAMFAAVISILAYVKVPNPLNPAVAITGQTLGVMLAGCILTTRQATMSILTYLLLGIVGLPVFSGGTSGFAVLTGPRGGYLIGFLVGAIVITLLKGATNNILRYSIANVVGGIIIIYIIGIGWQLLLANFGLFVPKKPGLIAAIVSIIPYVPGDIFKVIIATVVAVPVNRQVKRLVEA